MAIAKKHLDRLQDIKSKIEDACDYFKDNVQRYNEFVNFVFNTSLTQDEIDKLSVLGKPAVEFNILEALISRLRGEFSKQEPSVVARASDGVPLDKLTPDFLKTIDVVEAHLREIFFDADNDALEYKIYSDLLAGGFSVVEIYTDYVHEQSFDQKIFVERAFDPTLCGFDPMARESHKGDGNFCFQLVPKTKEEFILEFGEEAAKEISFSRGSGAGLGDFNWSYKNQNQDIVLVADFYEKKKKHVRLVKLSNGHVMEKKDYKRALDLWEENNILEQPPIIISERWGEREHIERYRLCGQRVLEHTVTSFKHFPLVFVDGNSVLIRGKGNVTQQMTRPYVYHAKSIQQLKNFSGQTIASEIENMVQHKFKVSKESIPEDYQDAYTNVQQASVLVYNTFYQDNPEQPLPPPQEIQRTPTPPIVENTFLGADKVTQTIIGSYDGILGVNSKQISGVAIQQGALQSNAAALPYLVGYINGLNRVAQIIIDLIPKYYVTPRSIPIRTLDGRRAYQVINNDMLPGGQSVSMGYDPQDMEIRIEAGPNAAIQKQVALDQIIRMMQASPLFAEFINTKGLETIIDNMDIRGVDTMKAQALQFMQEQQQKAEQAAQQGNPALDLAREEIQSKRQIEAAKVQVDQQKVENARLNDMAKLALEKQKQNIDFLKIKNQIAVENAKLMGEVMRQESEDARELFETAISEFSPPQ